MRISDWSSDVCSSDLQEIVDAISRQAAELDYAPSFQIGHPNSFLAATAVAGLMPEGLDRIFFTNSGSESVDTALKIALAYHRARGEGQRTRLIGNRTSTRQNSSH